MQKQEKANKARQALLQRDSEQGDEKADESINEPSVALAKTTKLVFFRQYNTYQALLEI